MPSNHEKKPPRARITLLNLLLLTMTAATAVALFSSHRANRKLQITHAQREAEFQAELSTILEENLKLRAEQGALTIEDPKKVYAIRMPKLFDDVWRYRVYLPPGQDYYVAAQVNHLPQGEELQQLRYGNRHPPNSSTISSGVSPKGGEQVGIGEEPGEIVVTVRLGVNEQGERTFSLGSGPPGAQGSSGFAIRSEPDEWPAIEKSERAPGDPPRSISTGGVSDGRQVEQDPKRLPLVLLNYRVMHSGVMSSADSDEGVLVWVGRADEQTVTTSE